MVPKVAVNFRSSALPSYTDEEHAFIAKNVSGAARDAISDACIHVKNDSGEDWCVQCQLKSELADMVDNNCPPALLFWMLISALGSLIGSGHVGQTRDEIDKSVEVARYWILRKTQLTEQERAMDERSNLAPSDMAAMN